MDTRREGEVEEGAPLMLSPVEVDVEEGTERPRSAPPNPAKGHARDVHVLSAAFFFVFCAYHAAQNLESSINTEHELGTTSLGVLYLSFTLFSLVGSPIVRVLGSKRALVLGTTGYWLFIAANLKPSWYTMIPASVYLGFASAITWVGQGTYLTCAARSHAKDCDLHEGMVIGNFNGEFWGIFAGTQVFGNLVSLILLKGGKEGVSSNRTTLLFSVFLGSMTLGAVLMFFISKRDARKEDLSASCSNFQSSDRSLLKSVIVHFLDKRMLLIIPLLAYSGLQQAFVWAEFTKNIVTPVLGVSGVGGAMAVYGSFDVVCSLIAGRLTSGICSITIIVSGAAFLEVLVLIWIILKDSLTGGTLSSLHPLLMAAMLGIGDGALMTQLNALLGLLFKNDTEAAFAQLKVWQSASTALVFFLSPHITMQVMLILMLGAICLSMPCFLYVTLCIERAFVLAHRS